MERKWRHKETLHLTLKKEWFDRMITGEKKIEIRKPTEWLMSRIYKTTYNYVKFKNGYAKDAPYFIAEYNSYGAQKYATVYNFHFKDKSIAIQTMPNDIIIYLGKIVERSSNF